MKKKFTQLMKGIWLALVGTGLLSSQLSQAQSIPDVQWAKSGSTLAVTTDGGIVTTNFSSQGNNPGFPSVAGDALTKYSPQGNTVWSTGLLKGGFYLGGQIPGYDHEAIQVQLIAPTTDGGVAVAGKTSLRGANVATKISADGTPRVWQDSDVFFNVGDNTIFEDLVGTPDGGFLLLLTAPVSNSTSNVVIRKYDASANFVWTKRVAYSTQNPSSPDRSLTKGEAVINAPDGGFLIVGYYNTTGVIVDDANPTLYGNSGWVAKLDSDGNVQWQKLLTGLPPSGNINGPLPNTVVEMLPINDVTLSADGTGYALFGFGLPPHSVAVPPPSTALLELNLDGSFKRARLIEQTVSPAFITTYIASNQTKYYAVGHTSFQNGADPEILLIDPASLPANDVNLFRTTAQRIFDSGENVNLQGIGVAGDGSLVYVGIGSSTKQIVKLNPNASGPSLTLLAPTYNCSTGAITFNVSGGNSSPITYTAPGISRASATDNFGTVEAGLRFDPKVIQITATQSGVSVVYNFDLKAACSSNPTLQPPVVQPIPDQFLTVGQSLPGSGFPVGNYFSDPNVGMPNYLSRWSFSITGLPDGLFVFSRSQDLLSFPVVVILGTPTTAGQYTVTVRASTEAFRDSPIITTFKINVSSTPGGSALTLLAPTYNCSTGAITFNVSGGNGSPITYTAPGISRASATDNFGTVEAGLRFDPKVIQITATQNGVSVVYNFDLKAACSSNPTLQPPVVQPIPDQFLTMGQSVPGSGFAVGGYFSDPNLGMPNYVPRWSFSIAGLPDGLYVFSRAQDLLYTPAVIILGTPTTAGQYTVTVTASTEAFRNTPIITTFKINVASTPGGNALTLLAPTYNCSTGAITFNVSGGNGSPITYTAPGISRASVMDNFGTVEPGLRFDPKVIQITATQNGVSVVYNFDLKAVCSQARLGVDELGSGLQVRVLGNPVEGKSAEVEIRGVEGKPVNLRLVDSRGGILNQIRIDQAETLERVSVPMGDGQGLFLLQVNTASEQQKIKLLKP